MDDALPSLALSISVVAVVDQSIMVSWSLTTSHFCFPVAKLVPHQRSCTSEFMRIRSHAVTVAGIVNCRAHEGVRYTVPTCDMCMRPMLTTRP